MDEYSIYPKQFNKPVIQIQINTCFVVMPFSEDLDNTYMVIESAASAMGIQCTRADCVSTTSEPILNKICTQISQAYFIIVDITNLNPNVFYELGIAHVLRDAKKILIIKEKDTECPSDIKHLHYYAYSKIALKKLKETIKCFFKENNIQDELLSVLDFLGITPRDKQISQEFVANLSKCLDNNISSLLMILNNRLADITQWQANSILLSLTHAQDELSSCHDFFSLYSSLILLFVQRLNRAFDISSFLSQVYSEQYHNLSNEWIAECSIIVLDNPLYFEKTISWIIKYLMKTSPAAFDVAKYKLEIGIIKSKSERIDSVLINELKNADKTLVEHCAKLIKERKTDAAIPFLIELVEKDDNPYVVRSCIDALVQTASLDELLRIQESLINRESFLGSHSFIKKHLPALEKKIDYLQNVTNR